MTRRRATTIVLGVVFIFGNLPSILSDSTWSHITLFGMSIFDAFDYISANILFLSTRFLSSFFIGFVLKKEETVDELTNGGKIRTKLAPMLFYYLKFVIPALIILLFIISF